MNASAVLVPEPSMPRDRPDGRHARRERNRHAVVEALLDLYCEGNLNPSTDQIADRAGLSPRSLFRYFDDVDDLCRVAIRHQGQRIGPVPTDDVDIDLSLDERAAVVATRRVQRYEAMSYVGVVARLRAPFQPLLAEELAVARRSMRRQLQQAFSPELDALDALDAPDPVAAERVVAAADVMSSFESYRLLVGDGSLTAADATDVFATGFVRIMGTAST